MKTRSFALLMTATMAVSAVGCSSSKPAASSADSAAASTENVTADNILNVAIGPNPETIDPALNTSRDVSNMVTASFEGLLKDAEDGSIVPGQAESWEVSEDGKTYTFHIREGLKWSDGSDLNANDFVYSWQRMCDPQLAAPFAETALSMVEGYDEAIAGDITKLNVEAPDDLTFVVHLKDHCPYFDSIVACSQLSPVQKATVEENGDAWATSAATYISNGPFYVAEWVPSSYILMKKNPNYYDVENVKLDGVKFNLVEEANAAYIAFNMNELDMVKDIPSDEIPAAKETENYHVEPMIGTYYITLNTEKEPFNNKDVRKALSLAIDRDYVANTLMQGTYSPAGNIVGPGWKDTDGTDFITTSNGGEEFISTTDYEKNLEEAKQLLADAGYPDGVGLPVLTYSTNDAEYHKTVAEYLQQCWKELGVTLEVEIVDWASFTPIRRNGDFEIARNGWVGDYSDPSDILEIFYSTNGNNDGNYNNPQYDAQLDIARSTLDSQERSQALHKAEEILMEDAGCIPLAYYEDFWIANGDRVQGVWHSITGHWHFEDAEIVK
ncbi:MAG: peptide ABC transporter substrate-binding protein [Allobaculum sp.]